MKSFLFLFIGLMLGSCDVFISLPYAVRNQTSRPVKVFVPHYNSGNAFSVGVDTILEIQAHTSLFLGATLPRITGPVGASRRIYRSEPGLCGLKLIQTDTVAIGCTRKHWKFRRGISVWKIR